jgi:hypothetical protein
LKPFLCLALFLQFLSVEVLASRHSDIKSIQSCLSKWGKTPFSTENPEFRTLKMKIKVLGIGGNVADEKATDKPDLVLVKANISVLSATKIRLLNPNGWYCLKGKVDVLGKTTVQIACNAKIASTGGDGANVLGAKDTEGGTTVLGTARIRRMGCASREETAAKEALDRDGVSPKAVASAEGDSGHLKGKNIKTKDDDDDDDDN